VEFHVYLKIILFMVSISVGIFYTFLLRHMLIALPPETLIVVPLN
jgi:hypothetical protein